MDYSRLRELVDLLEEVRQEYGDGLDGLVAWLFLSREKGYDEERLFIIRLLDEVVVNARC